MRRQEAFDGTAAEANRDQRLDPFALPVTYAVPMAGRPPGVATSATIDRNLAILTRPSGSLTLPVKAFRGVAVRMEMVGPTGELSVVLELNHADPSLSLPLIVAGDPAEGRGRLASLEPLSRLTDAADRAGRLDYATDQDPGSDRTRLTKAKAHVFLLRRAPPALSCPAKNRLGTWSGDPPY